MVWKLRPMKVYNITGSSGRGYDASFYVMLAAELVC
jgi:hypothetical protein